MLTLLLASLLVTQQADTLRISLDDAIEIAWTNNPNFKRTLLNRDNDELEWQGARANRYLPELNLRFTSPEYVSAIRRVSTDDGSDRFVQTERRTVEGNLELSQPLPTGGTFRITGSLTALQQPNEDYEERYTGATFLGFRLDQDLFGINNSLRRYRLARESYIRSEVQFEQEELELEFDVIEAYYDLVQAIKEADIDSVLHVRDSIRLSQLRDNPERGALSLIDSLQFEADVGRSAFNRIQSSQSLRRERANFNERLGLPPETVVVPDAAVQVEELDIDIAAGIEFALENRRDLELSRLSVENREASLRDARKTSPITLSIESTMGFDGSADSFGARRALQAAIDSQDKSTSLEFGVSIPLFDRFEEKRSVARAQNDLESSRISHEENLRELANEVTLAGQEVQNSRLQLDLAEKQYQITQQTLQLQTERYSRGEIGSMEFLIDQADAREAEIDLLEASVDLLLASERWKRAIGMPSARHLASEVPPPTR